MKKARGYRASCSQNKISQSLVIFWVRTANRGPPIIDPRKDPKTTSEQNISTYEDRQQGTQHGKDPT